MSGPFVLDASVLMAAVLREPGHERLHDMEEPAYVSAVNMAEARSRLGDKGMDIVSIETSLSLISKVVVDFTDADAKAVARLRPTTRLAGLALGDRACIVLAMAKTAIALTADRAWASVNLPIEVEFIR